MSQQGFDDNPDTFADFVAQVQASRPDITFTFRKATEENGYGSHEAYWTFPGAVRGGSVMWIWGTKTLCWGIDYRDMEAWREYEYSCGREPRYE